MIIDLSTTSTQIPCTFSTEHTPQRNFLPGSQSTVGPDRPDSPDLADPTAPDAPEPEPAPVAARSAHSATKGAAATGVSRSPTPISSPVSSAMNDLDDMLPDLFGAPREAKRAVAASARGGGGGRGSGPSGGTKSTGGGMVPPMTEAHVDDEDEFEAAGITEVSELHFQQFSSARKRSPRVRSSMPMSDIDHVDISGASSPPMTRRSPIRPPSSPTQSATGRRPRRIVDSQEDVEGEETSQPSPPPRARPARRKTIISDEDEDEDADEEGVCVPATAKRARGKTPAMTPAKAAARSRAKASPVASTRVLDSEDDMDDDDDDDDDKPLARPTRSKSRAATSTNKGKGRAMSYDLNDDGFTIAGEADSEGAGGSATPRQSTGDGDNDDNGGDGNDENDEDYGDDDIDYDSIPFPGDGIGIPDFAALPSTYPRRTPTPDAIVISDSDDSDSDVPQAVEPLAFLRKNKANAAVQKVQQPGAPAEIKFPDLKLIPELDERWQNFYRDHFRRGADDSDDGERGRDEDPRGFGVAAPAGDAKRQAALRNRGRGWGRGRGRFGRKR